MSPNTFSRNKIVQTVLHPALDKLGISRKGKSVGLHAFGPIAQALEQQTLDLAGDPALLIPAGIDKAAFHA